jgi:hypothetical protein
MIKIGDQKYGIGGDDDSSGYTKINGRIVFVKPSFGNELTKSCIYIRTNEPKEDMPKIVSFFKKRGWTCLVINSKDADDPEKSGKILKAFGSRLNKKMVDQFLKDL